MPHFTTKNGRIRTHKIDINAASHCNYSCAECSHLSPYVRPETVFVDTFRKDVNALSAVYHAQRLHFVGGEPLLNKELPELIKVVRESGLTDRIVLVTNGSLLHKASESTIAALDSVIVSLYPDPRCDETELKLVRKLCRRVGTSMKIMKISHFRRMQVNSPATDQDQTRSVFKTCRIAHSMGCQTIHQGQFYLCSRPLFTPDYLRACGVHSPDLLRTDGCSLHEPQLLERLVRYMGRKDPLQSCSFCLGTVGKSIPWRQMSGKERRSGDPIGRDATSGINETRRRQLQILGNLERKIYKIFPSPGTARVVSKITRMIVTE